MNRATGIGRMLAIGCMLGLVPLAAMSAPKPTASGTTLAATKTIEICSVDANTWRYSGVIAVWNDGAIATQGISITDTIQNKTNKVFVNQYSPILPAYGEIPAGTTLLTATTLAYSIDGAPLPGTIRNVAKLTILNHSGNIGKAFGPEPKATFFGEVGPCDNGCEGFACGNVPACPDTGYPTPGAGSGIGVPPDCMRGCTYSQGYFGAPPQAGHVWPTICWPGTTCDDDPPTAYASRTSPFYLSTSTWEQILTDNSLPQSNGYYQLAVQYVAAVLNAQTESIPNGLSNDVLLAAKAWFEANTPAACPSPSSCGVQKDWAATLADYNTGQYGGAPIAPPHCGDEVLP